MDFSLQPSFCGAGNSGLSPQLPSAICNLPMKIVLDKIWREADSANQSGNPGFRMSFVSRVSFF